MRSPFEDEVLTVYTESVLNALPREIKEWTAHKLPPAEWMLGFECNSQPAGTKLHLTLTRNAKQFEADVTLKDVPAAE